MAQAVQIIDYYKFFEIERTLDEKSIKKQLAKLQQIYMRRQSSTNDKEELLIIDDVLDKIGEAIRFLTIKDKREKYDRDLEKAYKEGKINVENEGKAKDLLEQADQLFKRGRFKQAVECALEAIENSPTNEDAYDLAIRSYASLEQYDSAFNLLNKAISSVTNKDYFVWLSARLYIVGLHNYEAAQEKINILLAANPDSEVARSEQIFLYMYAGKEDLAFQEIDSYLAQHPGANKFRKDMAYNIIKFSNSSYVVDPEDGVSIIADKQGYERVLRLRKKAYEVFNDEYTKRMLDDAKFYGQRKFNKDNLRDLLWMWAVGLGLGIYYILSMGTLVFGGEDVGSGLIVGLIGIFLLAMPILLTIVSFRPYWQLNRIYLTGDPGLFEKTVLTIGKIYTWLVKKALWLLWTLLKMAFVFFRELTKVG